MFASSEAQSNIRFCLRRFSDCDSYVDAPYGKSWFCHVAVIGCFHMSGLFVRRDIRCWP
jgi:hypothetical protein